MNESENNVRFGNNLSCEDKPFIDMCAICLTKKKIEFSCYTCETCKICKKCMYNYKIYKENKHFNDHPISIKNEKIEAKIKHFI